MANLRRVLQYTILVGVMFSMRHLSRAQSTRGLPNHEVSSVVPFVGCKSDGQVGPLGAPKGNGETVQISAEKAQRLAYYKAEQGWGVLAPRGWYCFETYGSNGESLFVSPQPIGADNLFSRSWKGFTGPAIQISCESGGTSGRFGVARMIARVFPAHRDFVRKVIAEGVERASDFPFGPYPKDKLRYKSNEMVEYRTPSRTKGLGTDSRLLEDVDPIRGVAVLVGPDTDLAFLAVRLLGAMSHLVPTIVEQLERETAAITR